MATIQKLIPLVASSAILLAVDGLYLNNIGIATFKKNVELIQKSPLELNMYGALLSYVCVIGVLYYLSLLAQPRLMHSCWVYSYRHFEMTKFSYKHCVENGLNRHVVGGILLAFTHAHMLL